MAKKLRVAHLTSMHEWDDDRIYQRACIGLARNGFEVHLIAQMGNNGGSDHLELNGVSIHFIERRVGWKRRWYSSREVVRKAIDLDCDIYHFHDPDLLPHIAHLKKKRPGVVVIYDIHENYSSRFELWGLPKFIGELYRYYENRKICQIDGCTVVSESMKRMFLHLNKPIEITRNSADVERLRRLFSTEVTKNDVPVVITSGSHSHERNCLQTVKSIALLESLVTTKFHVQFVGRYLAGLQDELMNQAVMDGTDKILSLDGMMPWEENFNRLRTAFCGCVFYADNPNNRVGIPNRLFEYMFCGLPVVVSNFDELKTIVDDAECGVVVDSENPVSIADGLASLLSNPVLAEKMGANGKRAMEEKYGYHVDLARLIDFYSKLYNSK